MAKQVYTELQRLGLDVYKNRNLKFNEVNGDDAIRNAILDAVGGSWSYYNYMDNKGKVFAVISEVLSLPLGTQLTKMFEGIVDVNHIGLGEKRVIRIEDPTLFRVAKIARGTNSIRRQRIYGKTITVQTEPYGIKIYAEFDKFMNGTIDWSALIDRVRKSVESDSSQRIAGALVGTFSDSINPLYNKKGTFTEAQLDELISRVKAKTGMSVGIFGTSGALGKITSVNISDSQKEAWANLGYYGKYKGTAMVELPQSYKNGTEEFALRDDILYILPVGLNLMDMTYEGDPIVMESNEPGERNDQQIEFQITYNMAITVLLTKYFGMYDLD